MIFPSIIARQQNIILLFKFRTPNTVCSIFYVDSLFYMLYNICQMLIFVALTFKAFNICTYIFLRDMLITNTKNKKKSHI